MKRRVESGWGEKEPKTDPSAAILLADPAHNHNNAAKTRVSLPKDSACETFLFIHCCSTAKLIRESVVLRFFE
jgi:hypothetical protein